MADVFLSYASGDRARVEPVARALIAAGHSVWWDRDIPVGADFSEEVEREIALAKAVVVCWSKASCASKWVRDEAAYARDKGKLVPLVVDAVEPPLGFRQNQTLDFSNWKGDAAAPAFAALDAAIRRAASAAPAALPIAANSAGRKVSKRTIAVASGVAAALALAVGGFAAFWTDRPPTEQDANAAGPLNAAVAELEKSRLPEERAAYESFVGGDEKRALTILERLAADLERRGDKAAAAETYTRVGAIALLVDQPRGLAARRKAFDLAPHSFAAFQGLFFDTHVTKGAPAAEAFAQEIIARDDIENRLRGYAYAHLAIPADARGDHELADEYIARIGALSASDPVLKAIALWAGSDVDWRRDALAPARAKIAELDRIRSEWPARLDVPLPTDVTEARIRFSEGDWAGAHEKAVASLDQLRKADAFIPSPLVYLACDSGLYTDRLEEAAPYCAATATYSGADSRLYSAELAAARGDLDEARAELDAARAIGGSILIYPEQQLRLEAHIAALSGDLDGAQNLSWRHIDSLKTHSMKRSRRATALRLYALWMIDAKAPERACAPLKEAQALYNELGGKPGEIAAAALLQAADCNDGE